MPRKAPHPNALRAFDLSPHCGCRIHTSELPGTCKADSVGVPLLIRGGGHVWDGIRAGAVRRPPAGKRGAVLHAALVGRPGPCNRRLAGTWAREIRFTRFLRNPSVT